MAMLVNPSRETSVADVTTLFRSFLQAANENEADRFRARLLVEHVDPLLCKIISNKMCVVVGRAAQVADPRNEAADGIYCEALVALGRKLDRWRRDPSTAPPADKLLDYVAVVAYNACKGAPYAQAADLDPQARIYDLLSRQSGLALWKGAGGQPLAGFERWRDERRPPADPRRVLALQRDPEATAQAGLKRRGKSGKLPHNDPVELLAAVLDEVGGPVEFDVLTSAFAILWAERVMGMQEAENDEDDPMQDRPDTSVDLQGQQERRNTLRRLWEQIKRLPPDQCAALLLNLQDGEVMRLPEMEIATFAEIAAVLGRTPEELAAIWYRLPLDDETLAEQLNVSVQRVKNLRQAAHRTLAWRMRAFDRGALRRLWQAAIGLEAPRPAAFMLYVRDAHGMSVLALLPRESVTSREEISTRLRIAPADLNALWPALPLDFVQIARLLNRSPQQVAALYQEACRALREQLMEIQREG